jgi:GDPmannose 4,6-dehydratase
VTRRALITGITGQDGSYLADLLLSKGYEVHGLVRRSSTSGLARLEHILQHPVLGQRIVLHHGDVTDGQALSRIMLEAAPDEIYNLAAQSHVGVSFEQPVYTAMVTGIGALNVLEAARCLLSRHSVRVYQASSSEMFGLVTEDPQNERTPFHPRSPYGCAKVFAYHQTVNYRESYGLFAANGILFNHESPRRGEMFVTRKITRAAARIKLGLQSRLTLGNLDAKRDWGYAPDYVHAMWLMLQHDQPDDFIIASGQQHSVREWLEEAFGLLDLDWRDYVQTDPRCLRPTDVDRLRGDSTKARKQLHWEPATSFRELVRIMIQHDLELARRESSSPGPTAEEA